jgi:6-phosphogluconolactonase
LVAERSRAALVSGEVFSLVLSGGNTPRAMFELLAGEGYRSLEWGKFEVYFADERAVPPDHQESNYRLAWEMLLSKVPILPERVHRMRGEIDPGEAAKEYGQLLKAKFGDGGPDLVLLGMGPDGHTASLFPHTAALAEPKHRCVANYVEKLKMWRITMTAPFINRSRTVAVMVTGRDKAGVVRDVLEGGPDPMRLPIQLIEPASGDLNYILDAAASGMDETGTE